MHACLPQPTQHEQPNALDLRGHAWIFLEARAMDLGVLLNQAEAEVAPGQHYWQGFSRRTRRGSAQAISTSPAKAPARAAERLDKPYTSTCGAPSHQTGPDDRHAGAGEQPGGHPNSDASSTT